jgi:two-component system cell cycle response regulator DivK
VVEDQADNRQILRDLLGNAGYDLVEAENGEQALTALGNRRPDLILMDIQLPIRTVTRQRGESEPIRK